MPKKKKIRKSKGIPTQKYLDIMEIKDDAILLKDGTIRAVLLVSSINFALKSDEEQQAVIQNYVQFLNALDFNLQIVIQSRKLNIDNYIERLKKIEKEQTNELLRMQTTEYRQYIVELVEIADIMSKRFYVVVPFSSRSDKPKKFINRIIESISPTTAISLKKQKFEKFRDELFKRVDYVRDALSSVGLRAEVLDTQSLIELFYNIYNPETSDKEKMIDLSKINIEE